MHTYFPLAVVAASLLAGCASAPKIAEVGSVPNEATFKALYDKMDVRINAFKQKWIALETTQWHDAEWIAGGGGVSATAVAARATPYAVAGAALAGYVAMVDKFYGVDKQNLAWTKASHGLQCIKAVSTYIYVNADNLKDIESPDNPAEDGEGFVFRTLRTAMQHVDGALEDRLRIGAVSTEPNWSAFQTALQNAAKQQPATAKSLPADAKAGADLTKLATAVGRYKSDVDACLAAN